MGSICLFCPYTSLIMSLNTFVILYVSWNAEFYFFLKILIVADYFYLIIS